MKIELHQGNCLEVMKSIPDGSVDMILTDPPYGTTACKWDSVIDLPLMWEQLKRIIKPNGAIVMTASQPFSSVLGASNLKMLRYSWIWEKAKPTNFTQAKRMPLKGFEEVLVFYSNPPTYNPQGVVRIDKTVKNGGTKAIGRSGMKKNGDAAFHGNIVVKSEKYIQEFTNYPRGIVKFSQDSHGLHPTQKPVALMEYLIKTYTNEGETVLDFTMGSGTTGVACCNLSRSFIGIEMDENYFNIASKRIEAARAYNGNAVIAETKEKGSKMELRNFSQ